MSPPALCLRDNSVDYSSASTTTVIRAVTPVTRWTGTVCSPIVLIGSSRRMRRRSTLKPCSASARSMSMVGHRAEQLALFAGARLDRQAQVAQLLARPPLARDRDRASPIDDAFLVLEHAQVAPSATTARPRGSR